MTIELTAEQAAALAAAGDGLVVVDPRTKQAYRLVQTAGGDGRNGEAATGAGLVPAPALENAPCEEIPEGLRRARAALRRDLPALLASWWTRGKWAAYSGDGRIGVSRDHLKLLRECIRRGIPENEFVIELIEPDAGRCDEIVIE